MQTCPCNEYPLIPHFYTVKMGFTEVNIFYSFAPKHTEIVGTPFNHLNKAVLACTHNKCFEQMKFTFFLKLKKSLFIAWACFKVLPVMKQIIDKINQVKT